MTDIENTKSLTLAQGQTLVRLARTTIATRLQQTGVMTGGFTNATAQDDTLNQPEFSSTRATFVTLQMNGQLRGCMGSLVATEPLVDNVRHNAINAAFNDPRFPALTEAELTRVHIDISVLSRPVALAFKDGNDLIQQLRPGTDGVILQRGGARATFLPQVWEQLPKPEDFLTHLCMKAGLSGNCWQQPGLAIEIYQVQHFDEP